jgi:aminocarboxymuconate-semialdehyde decarboxylase
MVCVDPRATEGAIDAHSHIVTPDVLALLERDGAHYATRIITSEGQRQFLIGESATRPINDKILGTNNGAARIHDMDAEGIDCELVSCVPFVMYPGVDARRGLAVAQTHNDSVATFAATRSDRFIGMASVPLQDPPLAAHELERAHGLGLRSVMIPPNVQDHALDEPLFAPFWEAADALNMLVFIHPFDATPSGLLARYNLGNFAGNLIDTALAATALICGGVLERHPRLHVLLAHAGGTLPAMLGRLDNGYSRSAEMRASIPRPPSTYVSQLWFDTIAFNPAFLRSLIRLFGSDRFVTGSDYPVGGPPHPTAEVRRLELEQADEAAVLRLNALRLLEGP